MTTAGMISLLRLGYGVDDIAVRWGMSYRTIFSALAPAENRRVKGVPVMAYLVICAKRIKREEQAA